MTLSIILPSYNDADVLRSQLPELILWMKRKNLSFEIIVVDDGSDDSNAAKKVAEENHCSFIRLDKNCGKGAAVRKGMLEARGDFKMYMDADVPFEFEA